MSHAVAAVISALSIFWLFADVFDYTPKRHHHIKTIIAACESELPRNQRCILVAQPEE